MLGARHEDHSFGEKWGEPFSDFLNGDWDLRGGVTGFFSFFFFPPTLSLSTHSLTHKRARTHTANEHDAKTHTLILRLALTVTVTHTHTQQTSTTQRHTNWTRRSSTRGIIRTRKGNGRAQSRKRKTTGRMRQGRGGDVVCVREERG